MTLEKLNNHRYKLIAEYILLLLMILMFVITMFMSIKYNFKWVVLVFCLMLAIIFIIIYIIDKSHEKYRLMYREYISDKIYNTKIEDIYYDPKAGMSQIKIYKALLLRGANHYDSQYHLSGKINNILFEQTYANIYNKDYRSHGVNGNYYDYDYIFNGKWLIFYLDKSYKSNIQIIDKKFRGSINNWVSNSILTKDLTGKKIKKDRYTRYKSQNDRLNKKFYIYIEDENKFNLSNIFLENIYELSLKTKGKLILSIINNELHIGIQKGKNIFKPKNIFTKINDQIIFEDINNEINFIEEIIELLIKNM